MSTVTVTAEVSAHYSDNKNIYTKLKFLQNAIGAILSPFDSWLTLEGIKNIGTSYATATVIMRKKLRIFLIRSTRKLRKYSIRDCSPDEQKRIVVQQMVSARGA